MTILLNKFVAIAFPFIAPVAITVSCVIFGIIFEKIVLRKLQKIASRTRWEGDDIIIKSLQKKSILWFTFIGVYAASQTLQASKTIMHYVANFSIVILIFISTMIIANITAGLVSLYSRHSRGVLSTTTIFTNLTKLFINMLGILIILQYLGISITPILTALGVGGLAVALALQDTLSNLFAGIHITATGQIKIGDYMKLEGGEEGHVADITWRNTTIRTIMNNIVVIPNSKLASTIVTNYSLQHQELTIKIPVGVDYNSDLDQVERVTLEVASEVLKEVPGGFQDFEPVMRFHTFDDFSINFNVLLRVRQFVDQYQVIHEFVKRLHRRYNQEGIIIPFPIRDVHMHEQSGK